MNVFLEWIITTAVVSASNGSHGNSNMAQYVQNVPMNTMCNISNLLHTVTTRFRMQGGYPGHVHTKIHSPRIHFFNSIFGMASYDFDDIVQEDFRRRQGKRTGKGPQRMGIEPGSPWAHWRCVDALTTRRPKPTQLIFIRCSVWTLLERRLRSGFSTVFPKAFQ